MNFTQSLIQYTTFDKCPEHSENQNFWCGACGPMCGQCLPKCPVTHDVIQIRRYMYQNVVHVADIKHYFDVEGVQAYMTNGRHAVLLSPKESTGGFDSECVTCGCSLRPDCVWCSLRCKVAHYTAKRKQLTQIAGKRKSRVPQRACIF